MGTKIQANAFLREYHSAINSDRNKSNVRMPLYDESRITTNGRNLGSFSSWIYNNNYLGYDLEKMRRTIIDHESIFRNQLQELHRLYGRQRELMDDIRRREISKDMMHERLPKLPQASYDRDTELCLRTVQISQCSTDALTLNLTSKGFCENSHDVTTWGRSANSSRFGDESRKKHLPDDFAEESACLKHGLVGDLCSGKSTAFPQAQFAEPRKEGSNYPLGRSEPVSSRKRKIFGVEILEENEDSLDATSNASNSFHIKSSHGQDNLHLGPFEPPSWFSKSFMPSCEQGATAVDDEKNELSCQKGLSNDRNGKWLPGGSSVESNLFKVPCHNAESLAKPVNNLNSLDPKPAESLQDNLPWFLSKSEDTGDLTKRIKSSYFMNLDTLQTCSHSFFRKAEIADDTSQLNQENEIRKAETADDTYQLNQENEISNGLDKGSDKRGAKNILGFPVSDMLHIAEDINSESDVSKVYALGVGGDARSMNEEVGRNQLGRKDLVLQKELNTCVSGLRQHIDLNLALDEEDAPSALSLPTAIVKIATTEIDLETPAVNDSEREAELCYGDCDKSAAETIIAISLSTKGNSMDVTACDPSEDTSSDLLKWFAEVASSECDETDSVPDGMDHFEFMTLKLEDLKDKHYTYQPIIVENPNDDDKENATFSKRARRGQSKRGRQKKDFQKDILPGLVTLSRIEVTEDLQSFEELMKAQGRSWLSGISQRGSSRNGRARKRLASTSTPPKTKVVCSGQAYKPPVCQLQEKSLTGWGKRTRRLPRQRCPIGLSFFCHKMLKGGTPFDE